MRIFKGTNIGSVRKNNEDALFATQNLFLVADGMGGCVAGEIASSLLVETVKNYLNNKKHIDELILKDSIISANAAILNKVKKNPEYHGMGTTATMVYVDGNIAYYAHIGDSRLYLFRDNALKQVTEDHSYVAALIKKGEITEEEALLHPKKNFILRAVGVEQNIEVDTGKISLLVGDKLFLTTDGLTNCIGKEKLEEILSNDDINPVDTMIKYALDSVAKDNITAIVTIYD
ncbi:MAG: Stp1/IreP family PP2C-type Ser/Thr phosphatase [Selenomonadaceae bacterium]|nr:Stp1/IreP family PP2C-type Ser/Thr phosphatase [Selenomonadaceae bacterium]MBP3722033.1 Stp1/IreP family PP2C-type Ser/Thr phosphatase [Selenomonadaceae bacterium]